MTSGEREEGPLDLVSFGEVMVRLTPPGTGRLAQATTLELDIGGAEANVAVALARLGLRTAWISKLPHHPLGHRIAGELRGHGVDVSRIVWGTGGRVGLYFYERGASPRPSQVYYDRERTAIRDLAQEEVDWPFVRQAKVLHLTGITPALGEQCRKVFWRFIREVKAAGGLFAFDLNLRRKLWAVSEAAQVFREVLPQADVAFSNLTDARDLFGLTGSAEEVAEAIRDRLGAGIAVVTCGADRAVAAADRTYTQGRLFPVEMVDPLGAGDAFAAGFLFGFLQGDVGRALDYAGALAAAKCTTRGDFSLCGREELEEILRSPGEEIRR